MRLYGSTVSYEELSRVSFWRARAAAAGRAASCVCVLSVVGTRVLHSARARVHVHRAGVCARDRIVVCRDTQGTLESRETPARNRNICKQIRRGGWRPALPQGTWLLSQYVRSPLSSASSAAISSSESLHGQRQ